MDIIHDETQRNRSPAAALERRPNSPTPETRACSDAGAQSQYTHSARLSIIHNDPPSKPCRRNTSPPCALTRPTPARDETTAHRQALQSTPHGHSPIVQKHHCTPGRHSSPHRMDIALSYRTTIYIHSLELNSHPSPTCTFTTSPRRAGRI